MIQVCIYQPRVARSYFSRVSAPCRRLPQQRGSDPPSQFGLPDGGRANGKPRHPRRRAPSAGKITSPWAPIVRLPALDNTLIVMDRHVEMHEVYASVSSFRGEGEDQSGIWITGVKFYRTPGLDHQPLRDDLENRTGEQAIERFEC